MSKGQSIGVWVLIAAAAALVVLARGGFDADLALGLASGLAFGLAFAMLLTVGHRTMPLLTGALGFAFGLSEFLVADVSSHLAAVAAAVLGVSAGTFAAWVRSERLRRRTRRSL